MHIVTEAIMADGEGDRAFAIVLKISLFVEPDQNSFIDLDSEHVFTLFRLVPDDVVVDESHILAENGENE
jgi:hypothetical protein